MAPGDVARQPISFASITRSIRVAAAGRSSWPPYDAAVPLRAAFFDFGGVVLSSPFDAFNDYERTNGLPLDFIRTINSTDPDTNAWARFERSVVDFDVFCDLFEAECRAAGHPVIARAVMPLLSGEIRPALVVAIRRCRERLTTACLTNNWVSFDDFPDNGRAGGRDGALDLFHHVIESSKIGVRKPDPRFYEIACQTCGVDPRDVVFLDDLGVNLKPAAAMGMTTIKVVDPTDALIALEQAVGFSVT
jgi:putative hydrolase of the HAD superfamily